MSSDGVFTASSPAFPGGNAQNEFDEIKENFEFIRRAWMMTAIVPITGLTISYTYTSGDLTAITFSGTLTGSAAFTYTSGNLTQEVWTLYSKTITITHTYTSGTLTSSAVTVA